ncbi:uncharacterized protein BDW70DRAFT_76828 [Aspergillus foveolatus]|uniref:uncharacterized protein n=1 Tax=Aspergillus foveolatus TaxID=210207 RepID=UPI003CCD741E
MPDMERGQTTVAGRWTVRPGTTSSIEPPFHPRGLSRPPVWRMRPILRLHVIWRNFPVVAKKSALSPCCAAATSDRSQFDPAKPPILHMLPRKPRPNHSILSLESMSRYALVPGFSLLPSLSGDKQTCEIPPRQFLLVPSSEFWRSSTDVDQIS